MLTESIIQKTRDTLYGLILLTSIGCTQNSQQDSLKSKDFKPIISKQKLDSLNGSNFCHELLKSIHNEVDYKTLNDIVHNLSNGQKALHYFMRLDKEVMDGGFIRFYSGSYSNDIENILSGLKLINDSTMLELVELSSAYHLANLQYFFDQEKLKESKLPNKDLPVFDSLDNKYYKLRLKTYNRFEQYARNNLNEFIKAK